jgi:hypothetical protein
MQHHQLELDALSTEKWMGLRDHFGLHHAQAPLEFMIEPPGVQALGFTGGTA